MPKNRISTEKQAAYIAKRGVTCPFCGSGFVEGGSVEIDNGIASQEITCTECNEEWTDVYTLTGVTTEYHPPFTCRGCGREESICSADPCAGVLADREASNG